MQDLETVFKEERRDCAIESLQGWLEAQSVAAAVLCFAICAGPVVTRRWEWKGLLGDVVLVFVLLNAQMRVGRRLAPSTRERRDAASAVMAKSCTSRNAYVARELGDVDGRCPGGLTTCPGALDAAFEISGHVKGP
ncbi:hypothetical protein K466DRAFT_606397 [Polyporus arcularius HHB13444]|uniref:Uncharacterized protein n=1 Tax=Polyporus arcularius HHB13444 TaxID=1314778 RepID=A0A5C3NRV2_9APHY|nr:hypothetical protein K466DRAFT_606397 [Polyporus arcularius HHB13444]